MENYENLKIQIKNDQKIILTILSKKIDKHIPWISNYPPRYSDVSRTLYDEELTTLEMKIEQKPQDVSERSRPMFKSTQRILFLFRLGVTLHQTKL